MRDALSHVTGDTCLVRNTYKTHKNETMNILDLWHSQNLHTSKICTYTVLQLCKIAININA